MRSRSTPHSKRSAPIAILLDKHALGARYPTTIPGGVPAEAYDATDSERALEIAGEVLGFVEGRGSSTG